MTTLFIILIVIVSGILGFIVLVQNPKGGGLTGSIAGMSNQFMGVKQTTDVLEKGTWIFGGAIALLCMLSVFFFSPSKTASSNSGGAIDAKLQTNPVSAPANQGQLPTAPPTTPTTTPK